MSFRAGSADRVVLPVPEQAEEHGGLPGDRVHVRRAVHGQDVHIGHNVIHRRENGLLDLTCVLGTGDDNQMGLVVNHNGGLGIDAVYFGITLETGGTEDSVIRLTVVFQFLRCGTNQQLVNKQVLGRQFVDDTELLGINRVRASHAVKKEDLASLKIGGQFTANCIKFFPRNRTIYLAPRNLIVDRRGVDNKFVVGERPV